MKCLYCTTELPVDSDTAIIHCPLCGTQYDVKEGQLFPSEQDTTLNNIRPLREDDPIGPV